MRIAFVLAAVAALMSLASPCARVPKPGDPIGGLTRGEREQFERGRVEFARVFEPATGLGPLFNAESCAACHARPVPGGVGDQTEVHFSAHDPDVPFCDPLVHRGGPVLQRRATAALEAALGIEGESVPPEASSVATRTTPDVFGFGLLDAVPESTILALADPNDGDGDGISGRPNRFFDGRLGRFGRKAIVPTLAEFNQGAFVIEQGITNPSVLAEETIGGEPIPDGVDPLPEPEIDQETIDRVDAFVRFLAPPSPHKLSRDAKRGRRIFSEIGCTGCHVPDLLTGDHAPPALRNRKVYAYSDLLLHDMGPELADICLGDATPSEFRTEPLMGLRFSAQEEQPRLMHDGRAQSIEEAIRLHGGEAAKSRERFAELSDKDRARLLAFLRSL